MAAWGGVYTSLLLLSFGVACGLTLVMLRLAPRLGLVDEPSASKFHAVATPLGGGVAIFLASTTVLLFEPLRSPTAWAMCGAGIVLTTVGLIDDLRSVPAWLKFAILVSLTLCLWHFGIGAHTTRITSLDLAITVLWVTGVSSAFNAIDNMDGLATGITAIAAIAFFIVACQTGQWHFGGLCVSLLGASLGFLAFNFAPARIFMGDSGSFYLGFTLATLGVVGEWNDDAVIAAIIPVLVLGVPIFDLSFTVLIRHLTGVTSSPLQALNHCATDHISHRLVGLGLTPRRAVLILYLLAASFSVSAVSLQHAASLVGFLHLTQALILAAALAALLAATPAPTSALNAGTSGPGRRVWLPLGVAGTLLAALLVLRWSARG